MAENTANDALSARTAADSVAKDAATSTTALNEEFTTKEFFTAGTFATLAGATAAVVILTNTTTAVLNSDEYAKWLSPIAALACSVAAYVYAMRRDPSAFGQSPRFARYCLVILNACLIYTSAFGVQSIASETVAEVESSSTDELAEVPDQSLQPDEATQSKETVKTLVGWQSVLSRGPSRKIGPISSIPVITIPVNRPLQLHESAEATVDLLETAVRERGYERAEGLVKKLKGEHRKMRDALEGSRQKTSIPEPGPRQRGSENP